MSENNGSTRLNRIEQALELLISDHVQFREEHKQLLSAQVLLTGQVQKVADQIAQTAGQVQKIADQVAQAAGQLTALTTRVDRIAQLLENHIQDKNAYK